MKIVKNTSPFDTGAIRTIVLLAHRHIRSFEKREAPNWDNLRVRIRARSDNHITGRAYLHGCAPLGTDHVVLSLPRAGIPARRLLWLAYHELMHTFGYKHKQYADLTDAELERLLPQDYPLPLKPPVTRSVPDPQVKIGARIESLLARQRGWESRLKRARTALQKIQRSLRHYERKQPALLAAARGRRENKKSPV